MGGGLPDAGLTGKEYIMGLHVVNAERWAHEIWDADVLMHLHMDSGGDMDGDISRLLKEAKSVGHPRAAVRDAYIDKHEGDDVTINGVVVSSPLVSEKLNGIHRVFPYVSTCGNELEEWAAGYASDPMLEFVASTIMELALGIAIKHANAYVKDKWGIEKFATINPGSLAGWPITGQNELFRIMDGVRAAIGVVLKESCLMVPIKSTSGIIFPTDSAWVNCMRCPRENCSGRRAEYAAS